MHAAYKKLILAATGCSDADVPYIFELMCDANGGTLDHLPRAAFLREARAALKGVPALREISPPRSCWANVIGGAIILVDSTTNRDLVTVASKDKAYAWADAHRYEITPGVLGARTQTAPNGAQLAALQRYAAANGRDWKSKLNADWMRARYPSVDFDDGACLQQLRNILGPSWLVKYKLPEEG